jgi:hypothetical protein
LLKLALNKAEKAEKRETLEPKPAKPEVSEPSLKVPQDKTSNKIGKDNIKGLIGQFMQARSSLGSA